MRKIVLTYGLIAGAVMAAMMLLTLPFQDRIGFDKAAVIGYTTMVVAFLMVFFGVRSYRDQVADGSVSFGRAIAVGLSIVVVASICYVAAWELIYFFVAPDFADRYAAFAIEQARKAGASDAQIAARMHDMDEFRRMYRNPFANIALTFLEPLPIGALIALVSAVLLRRRRPAEGTAQVAPL